MTHRYTTPTLSPQPKVLKILLLLLFNYVYHRVIKLFFLTFSPRRLQWPTNVSVLLLAGRLWRWRWSTSNSTIAVIRSSPDEHLRRRRRKYSDRIVETVIDIDYCWGDDDYKSKNGAVVGERPARGRVHVGRFCVGWCGYKDVYFFRVRR